MASSVSSSQASSVSGVDLLPADSCSNGSVLSSHVCGVTREYCGVVPPQLPVFSIPPELYSVSDPVVVKLVLRSACASHERACRSYEAAYAGYVAQLAPASQVGSARGYGEQFKHFSSARSKGWREGTSFGAFQFSTRGSSASVVSSSAVVHPAGKCYLALVAGGHKRSIQAVLGRWPSLVQVLKVPAVKYDVSALLSNSLEVVDGMSCHVVPYSGCSVMASLARFVCDHSGKLNVASSSWEGTLLHAVMSRGDYSQLLDDSRLLSLPVAAVVGGDVSPSSHELTSAQRAAMTSFCNTLFPARSTWRFVECLGGSSVLVVGHQGVDLELSYTDDFSFVGVRPRGCEAWYFPLFASESPSSEIRRLVSSAQTGRADPSGAAARVLRLDGKPLLDARAVSFVGSRVSDGLVSVRGGLCAPAGSVEPLLAVSSACWSAVFDAGWFSEAAALVLPGLCRQAGVSLSTLRALGVTAAVSSYPDDRNVGPGRETIYDLTVGCDRPTPLTLVLDSLVRTCCSSALDSRDAYSQLSACDWLAAFSSEVRWVEGFFFVDGCGCDCLEVSPVVLDSLLRLAVLVAAVWGGTDAVRLLVRWGVALEVG